MTLRKDKETELDFEARTSYICNLTARDKGDPPRSTTKVFTISILDVNDNPPVVHGSPYVLNVSRFADIDAEVLNVINVTDADSDNTITFEKSKCITSV